MGFWISASGRPGIKHCLALNCICSFGSIHYRDRFTEFGILPLGIWVAHTAWHWTVYAVSGKFITGIGSWNLGFCLWALGDQTLLGNKVCMHCQFNSLRDWFTGFGSCLWMSGKQTLLCAEMHTQFGLNCVCSFRSTQCSLLLVIVSRFGSCPHGKAVTWLTNRHQASRGSHRAQLFDSIWFNLLGKRCSKIWIGYPECRTLPLGVSGAHNTHLSTAYAVWFNLVWQCCGKIGSGIKTSGHCIWASGEQTTLRYSTAHAVLVSIRCGNASKNFDWFMGLRDSASGHPGSKQSSAILLHM